MESTRSRIAILTAGFLAVGVAGFVGYLLYPRFDLPAATGLGLGALAAAAGFAAFFSPCSFPLLLTLLVREQTGTAAGSSLRRGIWIGLGAAGFLLALGMVIGAGGAQLASSVTFGSTPGRLLRSAVGVMLILLGLVQLGWLPVDLRWFEGALHGFLGRQASLRRRRPALGHALFGFGYVAAGFG